MGRMLFNYPALPPASLRKQTIRAALGYHKLSVKHLDGYLDELKWRFNNGEDSFLFRDTLLKAHRF